MYTWCSMEEWESEYFDFDWCLNEHGKYRTDEEARRDAMKHLEDDGFVVIAID